MVVGEILGKFKAIWESFSHPNLHIGKFTHIQLGHWLLQSAYALTILPLHMQWFRLMVVAN